MTGIILVPLNILLLRDHKLLVMDLTRVHLLITHLPIFGLFIGVFAFLYGVIRKDKHVKIVSSIIVIMSAVGGIVAFQTGEFAEETVEHISGVMESAIHEHEESAELVIPFYYTLILFSLLAFYYEMKERKLAKLFSFLVLISAAVTFSLTAYTASLGGKIRHTEIGNTTTGSQPASTQHDEDD
jgi:uncharacterized membrane protein